MYVDQNLSINQIKNILPYGTKLIKSVLKRNGIEVKLGLKKYKPTQEELNLIKQLIDNKESYHTIVKAVGKDIATIKRIVQENGFTYNYKPYNKNLKEDFFSNIDSSEKAWLLGFLYTDGSVRKIKNTYQIRLMIQIKDEPIIDKIISFLNLENGKRYDLRENKKCVGFEFSSKQMFDDLTNYGIIPNKTYTNQHLCIEKIPQQFQKDYVRGLFDGDGGISFTGNLWEIGLNFTAHFYSETEEFQLYIDQQISKTEHNKIKKDKGKNTCSWRGRQQVLQILAYLYDNATIYLDRKYEKYLWIKNAPLKNTKNKKI